MVRVKAIKDFTFSKYNEIKNYQPSKVKREGKIFRDDIFECNIDIAKYLLGDNDNHIIAIKVLEVIPD